MEVINSNNNIRLLPPQSIEAEQAVLGAILVNGDKLGEIMEVFGAHARIFYDSAHQKIFDSFTALSRENKPIDIITMIDRLTINNQLEEIGGHEYIVDLAENASISGNATFYAQIIKEKAVLRELIKAGQNITELAYESIDLNQTMDLAQQSIFRLSAETTTGGLTPISEITTPVWNQIEERAENPGSLLGTSSGFTDLDTMTAGLQRSDLVVVAARPSMGKCLGKGTKVLMFDGSLKKVENIKQGDLLMGNDSKPRKVLSIARGREKMYWVKQKSGINYRVNESHILSLKCAQTAQILNISVRDYLKQPAQTNYKGYKTAVEFAEKPLTVQAYFLGLSLGNPSQRFILKKTKSLNLCFASYSGKSALESPKTKLQEKYIPHKYLINSTANRLKLLAGLIDSSGHYDRKLNCYKIVQKNKKLAKQIKFLADSLGFRVLLEKKKISLKLCQAKNEIYRLKIWGNLNQIPTKRKKANCLKPKSDWKLTDIKLEYDQEDDYYGFTIDGNNLFLLEDMTVTHNTAFCLNIAENVAINSRLPVAIFSLEMSKQQLVNRLICSNSGVDSQRMRTGNLRQEDWDRISEAIGFLSEAPLFIDDAPILTVMDARTKARRLKAERKDLGLIVIDYIQLMQGSKQESGGNRTQEISEISRGLKTLARELNVPIIALSQLSRSVEARQNKRPMLSDLRESGAIEQDADMVMFLYRHEYYEPDDTEHRGECEVIIAKQRNGPVGMVKLLFHGATTKFKNLEPLH